MKESMIKSMIKKLEVIFPRVHAALRELIIYRTVLTASRKLLFHRKDLLVASSATTSRIANSSINDKELINRMISAYQRENQIDLGHSMWKGFFTEYHQPIHEALINKNEKIITDIFRNPGTSDLFYGFDILTKSYQFVFRKKRVRELYAKVCLDGLVRFAESTGAFPVENPENIDIFKKKIPWKTEEVLAALDKTCIPFSMPNPFPDEYGLGSSRGVISYRVPQALYQAWRIKQLVGGTQNPRILEIGAGLGRTAFYAHELGIKDYTIVDLPISTMAQAYYLGRTLGNENIHLDGEQLSDNSNMIKIITPHTFFDENKKYDLILNVDSLSELDFSVAQAYWDKIKVSTNTFLSINHETNKFRVRDLLVEDLNSLIVNRGLYWMRRGYAEELIRIPAP
jgi:hypothetical protein